MDYDSIKSNFDHNIWSIQMVRVAVRKGIITKEQFKTITGEDY